MTNHLLLIGIDSYPKFSAPGNELTTCVKDVTDFKYVLLEKYFFENENVMELLNSQATNLNIQKTLEDYIPKINANSNLIIYFSGHGGLRDLTNRGYWIPYDADEVNYSKWLPNETILEIVKRIKAKHIFIIADCCFASSLLITNIEKSTQNISLDNYKSRWVLTSGREKTYCGSVGENSFFGESLISLLGNSDENLRVGTIIEYIKEKFKSNILQQPQGYPLLDKSHDQGEFVFKLKEKKKLFEKEIKGYNLFKKVIDIYSKSNTIDEIENFEDKSNKIGYILLRENDKVRKEITHYLYLYNEINLTRTYASLMEKYKHGLKNIIVFLPKEEGQVFLERRLKYAEKIFLPKNIFYIDDFINNLSSKSTTNDDGDKYLNINNFITPEYLVHNNKSKIEINRWLKMIDNPILVIKGTAGIGKTTFAKYISDLYRGINKSNNRDNILFIDSNEIQEELLYLQKVGKKIDLYSFYKAATANESVLDKELFAINLDAGNLLLIIDGLDEIISRNLSFDIDYFFNSINSSNVGLGNSKIIITTRSYFWDKSNIVDDIIYDIELMPFDLNRTKNFFEKSFNNNENKLKRALQISEDFKLPSDDNNFYYHPFVLDIIKEIIESNNEILFTDNVFSSSILNKEIRIDYIIGRICEREIKRVQQVDLDSQIKLFIHLAVKENGKFSEEGMKDFIKESLNIKDISKNVAETFNSHPFLHFSPQLKKLSFRYDFFENYFTSLYISKVLDLSTHTDIDFNTIKLLSQKLYHGSDTIKNITKRVLEWNDDNLLKINDIINGIINFNIEDVTLKKRAISGIFNLALSINFKFRTNSRASNTKLIVDLFSNSKNTINNLVILNVSSLEENVRFDFSGLTFNNCIFESYSQFWDCNLNEKTYFYNCVLRNIGVAHKDILIPRENFIDCDQDNSLFNAFQNKENRENLKISKAKVFLDDFLKIFYKNGQFKKISDFLLDESVNYPRINRHGIKRTEITDILIENEILVKIDDKKHNDTKIAVNPLYIEIITKFCFEGKLTEKIIRVIDIISKKM
jgi:hypothetical protein